MKVRTRNPLVVEFVDDEAVISTPRATNRIKVGSGALGVLIAARAAGGLDSETVDARSAESIDRLLGLGFLIETDEDESIPSPWREWGVAAWNYHRRAQDARFQTPQERLEQVRTIDTTTRPPIARTYPDRDVILLPRVRVPFERSFADVLEQRRTHRDFVDQRLDLDVFSTILHYAFAPIRFADAAALGVLQLRAAASGGARHETEAFIGVFNVEAIEPGLYHYDNISHGLVPLDGTVNRRRFEHLTFEQGFHNQSAFGVLTAAITERMHWKYQHPRAYKALFHNAGHTAQVFSMICAALGLGASLTAAIKDTETNALLGLKDPAEFATFSMACGHPLVGPTGLPKKTRVSGAAPDIGRDRRRSGFGPS